MSRFIIVIIIVVSCALYRNLPFSLVCVVPPPETHTHTHTLAIAKILQMTLRKLLIL
jgi:hypothetical protein